MLAQAGLSIVVLEKGAYVRPSQIDGLEGPGFNKLYEKGGLMSTADASMGILAGATLGGGTTVNWACCLETPAYVRDEWAAAGLPQFAPGAPGFDTSKHLGVTYKCECECECKCKCKCKSARDFVRQLVSK